MAELQTIEKDILELGYQIVAISPDSPESLNASLEKHQMKYSLLSDADMKVAQAFGIAFSVPETSKEGLRNSSGGMNPGQLPVPSVFVLNQEGGILFEFCNHFLGLMQMKDIHLVIHDIGAPIGLSMAEQNGSRIKSITVLNSMLDVENFVKPLPMRPFEKPLLGEAELAMLTPATFPLLMKTAGVVDNKVISHDEMAAYIHLLKREDEGKAFLKIMRSFEKTKAFTQACYAAVTNPDYKVQLIWGEEDPFLSFEKYGKEFEDARPGITVTKVRSKHFLQEEKYETIAEKIKDLI